MDTEVVRSNRSPGELMTKLEPPYDCRNFQKNVKAKENIVKQCSIDEIELNEFFNSLPIRVIGSHEMPLFYARDILDVLGISNITKALNGFSEMEIVSRDLRNQKGITTYRTNGRKNNKMILLTEFGVYRILANNNSQLGEKFRAWFYQVLFSIRVQGFFRVDKKLEITKTRNEDLLKSEGKLKSSNMLLKQKLKAFCNLTDCIFLFEMPNNYKKIQASKVVPHEDQYDSDDSEFSFSEDEYDEIDNWDRYCADFPEDAEDRKYLYKVTENPSPNDYSNYTFVSKIYVKDAKLSNELLKKLLACYNVGKSVYMCKKERILNAFNNPIVHDE